MLLVVNKSGFCFFSSPDEGRKEISCLILSVHEIKTNNRRVLLLLRSRSNHWKSVLGNVLYTLKSILTIYVLIRSLLGDRQNMVTTQERSFFVGKLHIGLWHFLKSV